MAALLLAAGSSASPRRAADARRAAAGDGVKQWGQLTLGVSSWRRSTERPASPRRARCCASSRAGSTRTARPSSTCRCSTTPRRCSRTACRPSCQPLLEEFIERNFEPAGVDLVHAEPIDFSADPEFVKRIASPELREFAYYIHSICRSSSGASTWRSRCQQRHTLLARRTPSSSPAAASAVVLLGLVLDRRGPARLGDARRRRAA